MTTKLPIDADPARLAAHPKVQRFPSRDLTLFIQKAFLSPEECAGLIERIDAERRPSTIADANGDDYFRTSETCDLSNDDPFVAAVTARIAQWVGIDPAHGEYLQGQRYDVGQEFKAHTDFFDTDGVDFHRFCSVAGNRTWTVMIYLDRPEAGGATRFTSVNKLIQPEPGKLLAWNNRLPDGSLNQATMHQAMKVRKGVKRVITQWYRERPWA